MGLFLPQWLPIPLCAILCTLFTLYNFPPCLYMPKMYVSGHGKLSQGTYPAQFSHRLKTKHPSPSSVVIIQCSKSTSGLVWVAHVIVIPNLLSSNAQLTKLTSSQKVTSCSYLLNCRQSPWKIIILTVFDDFREITFDCWKVLVLSSLILAVNILLWSGKAY